MTVLNLKKTQISSEKCVHQNFILRRLIFLAKRLGVADGAG